MAAAHAVLDVLADERVLPRVAGGRRGAARGGPRGDRATRRASATCAASAWPTRSRSSPTARPAPRPGRRRAVKDALRRRGVLVGTTGRAGNVLKVRPPLAFTASLVPVFVAALTAALADCLASAA